MCFKHPTRPKYEYWTKLLLQEWERESQFFTHCYRVRLKNFFIKFVKKVWKEACNTHSPHIPHHYHHPPFKNYQWYNTMLNQSDEFKTLFVFRFSVLLKKICGMRISCPFLGLACPGARLVFFAKTYSILKTLRLRRIKREERWGGPAVKQMGAKKQKTKMVAIQKQTTKSSIKHQHSFPYKLWRLLEIRSYNATSKL